MKQKDIPLALVSARLRCGQWPHRRGGDRSHKVSDDLTLPHPSSVELMLKAYPRL